MGAREIVNDRLSELENKRGQLTEDTVLDDAKNPASPLHECFEWDDSKAGHAFRVQQARDLLRTYHITVRVEKVNLDVPAYIRDPIAKHGEQGMVSLVKLKDRTEQARQAVSAEFERVLSALTRARNIAAVLEIDITPHLDELTDSVRKLDRQVSIPAPKERKRQLKAASAGV